MLTNSNAGLATAIFGTQLLEKIATSFEMRLSVALSQALSDSACCNVRLVISICFGLRDAVMAEQQRMGPVSPATDRHHDTITSYNTPFPELIRLCDIDQADREVNVSISV